VNEQLDSQIPFLENNFAMGKIFGNLLPETTFILSESGGLSESAQTQWVAIATTHEMASKNSRSFILEYIYNKTRTYFRENC